MRPILFWLWPFSWILFLSSLEAAPLGPLSAQLTDLMARCYRWKLSDPQPSGASKVSYVENLLEQDLDELPAENLRKLSRCLYARLSIDELALVFKVSSEGTHSNIVFKSQLLESIWSLKDFREQRRIDKKLYFYLRSFFLEALKYYLSESSSSDDDEDNDDREIDQSIQKKVETAISLNHFTSFRNWCDAPAELSINSIIESAEVASVLEAGSPSKLLRLLYLEFPSSIRVRLLRSANETINQLRWTNRGGSGASFRYQLREALGAYDLFPKSFNSVFTSHFLEQFRLMGTHLESVMRVIMDRFRLPNESDDFAIMIRSFAKQDELRPVMLGILAQKPGLMRFSLYAELFGSDFRAALGNIDASTNKLRETLFSAQTPPSLNEALPAFFLELFSESYKHLNRLEQRAFIKFMRSSHLTNHSGPVDSSFVEATKKAYLTVFKNSDLSLVFWLSATVDTYLPLLNTSIRPYWLALMRDSLMSDDLSEQNKALLMLAADWNFLYFDKLATQLIHEWEQKHHFAKDSSRDALRQLFKFIEVSKGVQALGESFVERVGRAQNKNILDIIREDSNPASFCGAEFPEDLSEAP